MIKNSKIVLYVILIYFILSLLAAYFIEYVLGHEPCKLCLYQRIPYYVSLILVFNILFLKKFEKVSFLMLSIVALFGAILAFYHFGIEQGFFNESLVCKDTDATNLMSKEDLLKQLKNNQISCKEVNFRIFGLSLASINTIFSLLLFYIFMKLFTNYESNR